MMQRTLSYLNPPARLGNTRYSFFFPLVATVGLSILSEIYAIGIVKDPLAVEAYIIFLNVALIIYFAFRDGIIGGFTSSAIAILCYFYIAYTHHFHGQQLVADTDTIITLAVLYIFLSGVIGFLRLTIDRLIEKEANARIRLETILEQLPVAVIVTNLSQKIEFVNKKTHELFNGQVQVGDPIEKPVSVMHISGRPVQESEYPSVYVFKTGKASKDKEFILMDKNGGKTYLKSYAGPVKNKKGETIAVASISEDITLHKEHEEQKDEFIKMASHELKTPLTSAKVFTQVLEKKIEEKNDKELEQLTDRLHSQIDKLALLVGDLLDVSRVEKGKLRIKREKFIIRPLVEEVVQDLQPISEHGLILQWTTRLPVFGDKERIRQVLTNLIANAIKYSPEDTEIIIGSKRDKNNIEVYVKDFGQGIAKQEQKKIFNRFYQVAEHSTYPGLGLGLYISTQIIKQHKGNIWVDSEKGKGSTFWFSLPIYKQ